MRCACLFGLWLISFAASAAQLRDLRLWESAEGTRVVFDLSAPTRYKVFTLPDPDRVVVDLVGLDEAARRRIDGVEGRGVVRSVRAGIQPDAIRIVLDLTAPIRPESFVLDSGGSSGFRLVVDLPARRSQPAAKGPAPLVLQAPPAAAIPDAPVAAPTVSTGVTPPPSAAPPASALSTIHPPTTAAIAPAPTPAAPAELPAPATAAAEPVARPKPDGAARELVVVIDAGHGGADPGAIGQTGLQEKDVALSIARKLARLVNAQPGMRAVLTREGDYYVGLRDRINIARKHGADLFVSVHANAFTRRDMRGTAVYVVSDKGASSEHARWLAQKENEADLVGGVEIHGKDRELAAVLIDLSQSATMEASFDVGSRILRSMSRVNVLQKSEVQQAGFLVLKAPDIPSVLVETAFITNDIEERLLASDEYQDRMAQSILDGVLGYFQAYRPQPQRVAEGDAAAIRVR